MNTRRSVTLAPALLTLLTLLASGSAMADALRETSIAVREGNATNDRVGSSVGTAGDVNGDGISDVLLSGREGNGTVWCYHGYQGLLSYFTADWSASGGSQSWLDCCVSTAGDVNGDGYDDVLIGTPHYANGQTEEGAVYVYLGSPSGLEADPAAILEGNASDGRLGNAVDTAGDVNSDGFSDIVVGSASYSNGQNGEGRALVYLGSSGGIIPTPVWMFEGDVPGAQLGFRVCGTVDVNADGYDDIVVSAPGNFGGQTQEGRLYLFLGTPQGPLPIASWSFEPNQANARCGLGLGPAGDINGDGYGDIACDISAPANSAILVFFGRDGVPGAAPDRILSSPNTGFADVLYTAGDVNGDGCADLVGGEESLNGHTGAITVFAGAKTGDSLPVLAFRGGLHAEEHLGADVRPAGDVNGDGHGDIIFGAPFYDNGHSDEGLAGIYLGRSALPVAKQYLYGEQDGAHLGSSLAQGDWNGDGFTDVAIGVPDHDGIGPNTGAVSVHMGSETGVSLTPSTFLTGAQANAHFGASVSSAGDVNNDGYDDLVVGEPYYGDIGFDEMGRAYLYNGSAEGLLTTPSWVRAGGVHDAHFGFSVAGAGDVNGDGFGDVVAGAPEFASIPHFGGKAFLYLGTQDGLSTTAIWSARGGQIGNRFGFSVAGAGDVNGDGFSDLIVGAPLKENGQTDEGIVYVYFGGTGGIVGSWSTEMNQAGAQYGWKVASAGDLNADGLSDIVAAAPFHDANGLTDRGLVVAYCGSPNDTLYATSIKWGEAAGDLYGAGLAGGGDVNNDGFSDIIVGAPLYDPPGQSNAGRFYLYHGNAFGVDSDPAWRSGDLISAGSQLGFAVAVAGDVNGDGFADPIVGEPYWAQERGVVWIHQGGLDALPPADTGTLRLPRQFRSDGITPVALLGASVHWNSFVLSSIGRSARGRSTVRVEYQIAQAGAPWTGAPLPGGTFDTGVPVAGRGSTVTVPITGSGLDPASAYHWRVRSKGDSPFFPYSLWCSMPGNAAGDYDVRTAAGDGETGVDSDHEAGAMAAGGGPRIRGIDPNPCADEAIIRFSLPRGGEARLSVCDVTGRHVATLFDGALPAGARTVRWNARDAGGRLVASGVYLVRLDHGSSQVSTKVVVRR